MAGRDHWMHRDMSGWRLNLARVIALGMMLLIGIGIPELIKAVSR